MKTQLKLTNKKENDLMNNAQCRKGRFSTKGIVLGVNCLCIFAGAGLSSKL